MLILDDSPAISRTLPERTASMADDEALTCDPCVAEASPTPCDDHAELIIELL